MVSSNRQRFDLVQDSLLLVEGIDDLRFVGAFLRRLGKSNVQSVNVGGTPGFRPFLSEILTRDPNFHRLRSLGIVRDADESAASAFQSIRDTLSTSNLPAPLQPWVVALDNGLTVSVAILPDGAAPGNLEDLRLRSIEGSDELECVDQYMTCIAGSGPPHRQLSKARLHTYLAAGQDPGLRLGEAADAGVWDWGSSAFGPLADFLRAL